MLRGSRETQNVVSPVYENHPFSHHGEAVPAVVPVAPDGAEPGRCAGAG